MAESQLLNKDHAHLRLDPRGSCSDLHSCSYSMHLGIVHIGLSYAQALIQMLDPGWKQHLTQERAVQAPPFRTLH